MPDPEPSPTVPVSTAHLAVGPARPAPPARVGGCVLGACLGEGGMGAVYRAEHARLGRAVAVKLIHPEILTSSSAVRRFQREVRAAARVDHPFIVRSYDAGCEDGLHFLVLELVEGDDLRREVARRGPLPIAEAVRIGLEVALALQHLSDIGMVHRDLKPSNLIRVRATGSVKLLDLGLARLEDGSAGGDGTMTRAEQIIGTPDYMAPEQANNARAADIRSDLYSLGCTLHFVLTGSPPFPGGTALEKLMRHFSDAPPALRSLRADVPEGLDAIVRRLLEKSPARRFQTPAELAAALRALAAPPPPSAAPRADDTWREGFGGWSAEATEPRPRTRRRMPRWAWAVGLALPLAVLGALAALRPRPEPVPEKPPEPVADSGRRDGLLRAMAARPGTPAAVAAARELRGLPSPLDELPAPSGDRANLRLGDAASARHFGAIRAVAASRDGRWLATGGSDRVVRVWDARTLALRATLRGHQTPVRSVALSPDGTLAAGVSGFDSADGRGGGLERALVLWDVGTGGVLLRAGHEAFGWCLSAAFSPDGRRLLAGQYDGLSLFQPRPARRLKTLADAGMNWSGTVAFAPDGVHAFTGGTQHGELRVWDTASSRVLRGLKAGNWWVASVAPASDGRRLLDAADGSARVWDWTDGRLLATFRPAGREVRTAAWAGNEGEVALGLDDGSIAWSDAQTGAERRRSAPLVPGALALATVGLGDRVAAGGSEGALRLYDTATGREASSAPVQPPVRRLAFAAGDRELLALPDFGPPARAALPAGTLAARVPDASENLGLSADGALWIARTGDRVSARGPGRRETPVSCPDAGRVLSVVPLPGGLSMLEVRSDEEAIRYREFREGGVETRLYGTGPVRCLAASADGKLAAVGNDMGEVVLASVPALKQLHRIALGEGPVRALAFAADGEAVFAAGPGDTVWRVPASGGKPSPLTGPAGLYATLAVSPDGRLLAAATLDGEVALIPVTLGQRPRKFSAAGPVRALAFSADSSTLAVGLGNGVVDVYRPIPGR